MSNKNLEMMKKILEEKQRKSKEKQKRIIPSRYGSQSAGSGRIKGEYSE
ncbi:hypothetical protein [uncultured Clostridium sp.]|nr:hypothetical protein [uncultured Clostridium sp.]